jgi:hypothetical protein
MSYISWLLIIERISDTLYDSDIENNVLYELTITSPVSCGQIEKFIKFAVGNLSFITILI